MHRGDRQLARRLQREAQAAAQAQVRAARAQEWLVQRRRRQVSAARRRLPVQAVLAGTAATWAVAADAPFLVAAAGVIAGLGAARSLRVLRRPAPAPVPALAPPPAVPAPPPRSSAAFPAIRRLEAVRDELRRLVPLVAPAGREAAEEAWQAASEADTALRWQATRLAAVEPHRGTDPALLRALEDGVSCQERLVAAVADLVAATADPLATWRLQDATDRLHGLAQGLREVR